MEIELRQVCKTFDGKPHPKRAVDQVSWQSNGGEVFGLLGPNGAGKTTMIRMMLDIIRPDQGQVFFNGVENGNRTRSFKQQTGYLPEERGLYKKRKVMDIMLYFAALKGVDPKTAKKRAGELLEKFELADCHHKKIEDLSKGMGQKIQIASCILHEPALVVLDEPFSGLDPVNVRLVRDTIASLKSDGRLVFLSTHMMSEVEALCDRIFMINQGQQVLYGNLADIKKSYTAHEVVMDLEAQPEGLPCVKQVTLSSGNKNVFLNEGCTIHDLLAQLAQQRRPFQRISEASTPIEDIFVQVVKNQEVPA